MFNAELVRANTPRRLGLENDNRETEEQY